MLSLCACHKDEPSGPVVLEDLHLTWSLDSIPFEVSTGYQTAIFVNDSGVERRLTINSLSGSDSLLLDTVPYKGDWIDITYTDPLDAHLLLQIHASVIYTSQDEAEEIMYITNEDALGQHKVLIYFDHDRFEADNRFFEALTITGNFYQNVHANAAGPFVEDNREIYYTSKGGVVGFREADGELWGWRRWE